MIAWLKEYWFRLTGINCLSVWVLIDVESGKIIENIEDHRGQRKILTRTRKPGEAFIREYAIAWGRNVEPKEAVLILKGKHS
jgi:DNA topoisomerase VI subunit B